MLKVRATFGAMVCAMLMVLGAATGARGADLPVKVVMEVTNDLAPGGEAKAEVTVSNPTDGALRVKLKFGLKTTRTLWVEAGTEEGELVGEKNEQVDVDAGQEKVVSVTVGGRLGTGAYTMILDAEVGQASARQAKRVFVEPSAIKDVTAANSRVGLNVARIDTVPGHKLLGIGWVRFENAKWAFCNPERGKYAFDGSVEPWKVNMDEMFKVYHEAGLGIMPLMIVTPKYAAAVPEGVTGKDAQGYGPREAKDFGEFCFQIAARYGATKVAASKLLTSDKLSGLNLMNVYEIWNEPNLNPKRGDKEPGWGPWKNTMAEFWPVFRAGAEGVRAADPKAIITSPGFAGMVVETVDTLRLNVYADGKKPLDFCDVINVHYYSGRVPPEIAGKDPNSGDESEVKYEEQLRRLVDWRDEHKPGAPIWMTETGYDTGGPIGTNELTQAARLPRVVMMTIEGGVDKVIVYRESGSTPAQHAASGVLRNDYTRRPSWYTMATMIRQTHLWNTGYRLRTADENVVLYSWLKDGKTMVGAWTVKGVGKLGLELGAVRFVDSFGREHRVASTRELMVDDFPIYIHDITNMKVIDELTKQAKDELAERKKQVAAEAKREMYAVSFGVSDEPASMWAGTMRTFAQVPAAMSYAANRGYGFEGAAGRDGRQDWQRGLVDKTLVTITDKGAFRLDVKPGRYEVELMGESRAGQKSVVVTIANGQGKGQEMTLEPKNKEPKRVTVEAEDGVIRVRPSVEGVTMKWLIARRVD